jgi:hypothetical protein
MIVFAILFSGYYLFQTVFRPEEYIQHNRTIRKKIDKYAPFMPQRVLFPMLEKHKSLEIWSIRIVCLFVFLFCLYTLFTLIG